MLTGRGIQAGVRQSEPLHRSTANDMGFDDFLDIRVAHSAIPDGVRINDDVGSMLALVEAARLIRADAAFQPPLGQFLFEEFLQPTFGERIATSPRMSRWALVSADENMLLECRHQVTTFSEIKFSAASSASQIPSKSTKYPCTSMPGSANLRFAAAS